MRHHVRQHRRLDDLRELLSDWTYAASRITQGLDVTESGAVDYAQEIPVRVIAGRAARMRR